MALLPHAKEASRTDLKRCYLCVFVCASISLPATSDSRLLCSYEKEQPLRWLPKWGGFCGWGISEEDTWTQYNLGPPTNPDSWLVTADSELVLFRRYSTEIKVRNASAENRAEDREPSTHASAQQCRSLLCVEGPIFALAISIQACMIPSCPSPKNAKTSREAYVNLLSIKWHHRRCAAREVVGSVVGGTEVP